MSITDEFRERQESKPDKYTLEWWRTQFQEVLQGYRGATHGINRCLSEYADQHETIQTMRKQIEDLERERDEANSRIGEMAERLERIAEFMTKLKKNGN